MDKQNTINIIEGQIRESFRNIYGTFNSDFIKDAAIKINDSVNKKITELQLKNTIYQLFIGKVSDIIGIEKTKELLKESREAFNK